MTNYTRKTIFGAGTLLTLLIIAAIFAYLTRFFLTRHLSVSEYGLLFSLFSFVGILFILRDLGISQSTIFFTPRYLAANKRKHLKGLYSSVISFELISSLLICFLVILFANFLDKNYFHSGNTTVIILFAIFFVFYSFQIIIQTFFNAFQNSGIYALQNLSFNVILFLLLIIPIGIFTIETVAGIYILSSIIVLAIFSMIFFKRTFPDYFSLKKQSVGLKKLFLFGISSSLYVLGFTLITNIDTLMLTYYRSLEEVGLYNVALPIITICLYVVSALSIILIPMISELWAKKKIATIKRASESMAKFVLIYLIAILGILVFYPRIILSVLFGEKFVGASVALTILGVGALFYGLSQLNLGFILGINGPKQNAYIIIFAAILNLILNMVLIPKWGIVGAAIATSISYLVICIISGVIVYRLFKPEFKPLLYIGILASGAIFFFGIHYMKLLIKPILITTGILTIIPALAVYIGLLFLFRVITIAEIRDIKEKVLDRK